MKEARQQTRQKTNFYKEHFSLINHKDKNIKMRWYKIVYIKDAKFK